MSVPVQSSLPPPSAAWIDFGWIGQAWALFKAQSGVWVGAVLLSFLIYVGGWALILLASGEWPALQNSFTYGLHHTRTTTYYSPAPTAVVYQRFAATQARNVVLAGISAIFTGGLYRMALRQKRGEPISVSGLFSAFPQSLSLFLVGIVVPIALALIEGALMWPRHRFLPFASVTLVGNIYWILGTLLSSSLMFAPFFVLDTGASFPDALLGSVRLLRGQLSRSIVFYVAVSIIGVLGLLGCGVGMLATYPVFLISIAIGYLTLTQPPANVPEFDPAPAGVWPPPPRSL